MTLADANHFSTSNIGTHRSHTTNERNISEETNHTAATDKTRLNFEEQALVRLLPLKLQDES